MSLLKFIGELLRAVYFLIRERYYLIALDHVGHDHPDSWLITKRALISRMEVNDFLNKVAR